MEDTYTVLRHFADSWWLLLMMSFFIGCVLFALRPGSRKLHRDISKIPLRDDYDAAPATGPTTGPRTEGER
ncbi:cbb3-type cytochrome c oxidase subunit 3 [uncultured Albimonas sp.]|uniref:cbb3-type cytochrome c oxidase subunit 3 n=1 Tax=uncultured Albimonas sp. TaxID=1331701 RepID=UPI0030EF3AB6|tara:strand:+ start:6172 stop:6384 length:213 start_codon:yes stop_codon:yes gene_type:complete